MDDLEFPLFIISLIVSLITCFHTRTGSLHKHFVENNPGIGLLRLSVFTSMVWIVLVINIWADPSIRGFYVVFYLVIGYSVVKTFGQQVMHLMGISLRGLVFEGKNFAASLVISAFTLATGLIYGGSLWGEADPSGDDQGGWWIVMGFFLLGWIFLLLSSFIYLTRESSSFLADIKHDRKTKDAATFAAYILSTAVVLTDAVAGDFQGWSQGLLSFFTIAGMLLVHEILHPKKDAPQTSATRPSRALECFVYVLLAVSSWLIMRILGILLWGR
jgi:hypothetical protein